MATAKKTPASTAVATQQSSELAFAQSAVPDYIKTDGNRGSEEVKSSDMILPRLEIVQAMSPIKELNDEARDGHLFNSVTQELIGDMAYFVPIYYRMEFLVWQDQEHGGGFHGSFPTLEQAEEKRAQVLRDDPKLDGKTDKGGNIIEVIDTPVHYGLRIDTEGLMEQIVISMARTKSKVSRKWNAMIQIAGGDRFGRVYKLSTFTDENKKGQKFKNFVVQPAGFPPEKVYKEAERLYASFRSGEVTADHASAGPAAETAGDSGDRGGI
jgi:hypothetical protein